MDDKLSGYHRRLREWEQTKRQAQASLDLANKRLTHYKTLIDTYKEKRDG